MLTLKLPEVTEKRLVFGDYMTVHVEGLISSPGDGTEACDLQVNREDFFRRIQRERGEIVPRVQKPVADLIDVRLRAVAVKQGWVHYSEMACADEKIVA